MGLKICGNAVIIDHESKDYLYTTNYKNPCIYNMDSLIIQSVYRRKKSSGLNNKNRSIKKQGDNCPLIYALKNKDNLSIDISNIKKLMQYMPFIIDDIISNLPSNITDIVVIPSAYPLAKILAKRLNRRLLLPIHDDLFTKSTCYEATKRIKKTLNDKDFLLPWEKKAKLKNTIKRLLKNAETPYSSKCVSTIFRKYFDPLQIGSGQLSVGDESVVLLVDDLLASGESLLSADRLLKNTGLKKNCQAVTWFSRV